MRKIAVLSMLFLTLFINISNAQESNCTTITYYADVDLDGYGTSSDIKTICTSEGVYATTIDGDCDDTNSAIHPGATETCDNLDNDCNDLIDENNVCDVVDSKTLIESTTGLEILACTDDWNPVCGHDGVTYSNECNAKASGVEVSYFGECEYVWDENAWKTELRARVSYDLNKVDSSFRIEIEKQFDEFVTAAKNYQNSPSSSTAEKLAFQHKVFENYLWGQTSTRDFDELKNIAYYLALTKTGEVNLWENEFGEVTVGGLQIIRNENTRFRAEFNIGIDDIHGVWLGAWIQWDKTALENYSEAIKKGQLEGEEAGRAIQSQGLIAEYLKTFTISEENKIIALEILPQIEEIINKVSKTSISEEELYTAVYDSRLLSAKLNGLAQAFECEDVEQISAYIVIYSPGQAEAWQDEEFGETTIQLSLWKNFLEDTKYEMSFSGGECNDFDEYAWMDFSFEVNIRKYPELGEIVKKANRKARFEADALRNQALIFKLREEKSFTLEVEQIGQEIITLLENFKEEIISFEAGETTAYTLQYDAILLTSEIEGYTQAYPDLSEQIRDYVLLYGPGVADAWSDQYGDIELGGHMNVYLSDEIRFEFNGWCDDYQGFCGFNTWMNWGIELRETHREELIKAESEAWRAADLKRREALGKKISEDLEIENKDTYIKTIKDFADEVKLYLDGKSTAYDVELKRLQAQELLQDINEDQRTFLIVMDLEGYPVGDVWLEYDSGEINVGGFRELVTKREEVTKDGRTYTRERFIAGLDAWCDDFRDFGEYCGGSIYMNWEQFDDVKIQVRKANEIFYRQQGETELKDVLLEISNEKTTLTSADQIIVDSIVSKIASITLLSKTLNEKDLTTYMLDILTAQEELNDLIVQLSDPRGASIALAISEGFHEVNPWNGQVDGSALYIGDNVEIVLRIFDEFKPVYSEYDEEDIQAELSAKIDFIWKAGYQSDKLDLIEEAYNEFEAKQAGKKYTRLLEKREKILQEANGLEQKANDYENAIITLSELRRFANNIYYKLQAYDLELAYFAAVSGNTIPEDLVQIDIDIQTEHVKLSLVERRFNYRFDTGIKETRSGFGRIDSGDHRDFEFYDEGNQAEQGLTEDFSSELTGQITDIEHNGDASVDAGNFEETEFVRPEGLEVFVDQDAIQNIEFQKEEFENDLRNDIQDIGENRRVIYNDRQAIERIRELGGDKYVIDGLKPRMRLTIDLTDAEIFRLSEEFKQAWINAQEEGILEETLYRLNLQIDNVPAVQEAIYEWGNTTLNFKLTYKQESVLELAFRTEDGNIAWIQYGIESDAGSGQDNILIQLDFETLVNMRNWWENTLKDSESPIDFIRAIPGFTGFVGRMLISGDVIFQPFNSIGKIPRFMQVLFSGVMQSTGVDI